MAQWVPTKNVSALGMPTTMPVRKYGKLGEGLQVVAAPLLDDGISREPGVEERETKESPQGGGVEHSAVKKNIMRRPLHGFVVRQFGPNQGVGLTMELAADAASYVAADQDCVTVQVQLIDLQAMETYDEFRYATT